MGTHFKKMTLVSAMIPILIMGTASAKTPTTTGVFIADTTTVQAGEKVNISILGLDNEGKVDIKGEQSGSTILAVVTSEKGEVEATGTSGTNPALALFEKDENGSSIRYIKLEEGVGKVNISYPLDATGSDTIDFTLQELDSDGNLNIIEEATKTITILPVASKIGALDIAELTGGSLNDDDVHDGGIDGAITAGQTGAKIIVVAYDDMMTYDELGHPQTPALVEAAQGEVTLKLRPIPVLGNTPSESLTTLTGMMVKGKANILLPSNMTVADQYYIEATLAGYDDLTSIARHDDDTLEIQPNSTPKKFLLSSEKSTISDDGNVLAGTKLTACLLDEYNNQTAANSDLTANLKDNNEKVSNSAVSFIFSPGEACVSDILGDTTDEILALGTAALVVHIEEQTAIAESEEVPLSIVDKQLVATDFLPTAAIQASSSAVPNAFELLQDDGDGTFGSSNDKFVSDTGATTIIIRHIQADGESIELTTSQLAVKSKQLSAAFSIAGSAGEYYILADEAGDFGEVRVGEAIADSADIIAAAPSTYQLVNGHKLPITSLSATLGDDQNYHIALLENNLLMFDTFKNLANVSEPVTLQSVNGQVNDHADFRANDDDGDESGVSYDSNVTGDDTISFKFSESGLTGDDIFVKVPTKSVLDAIHIEVESTTIPVKGVVPVRVISLDQNEEAYVPEGGLYLDIEAEGVTVTVSYVNEDGTEAKMTNGEQIPHSDERNRSILAVKMGSEEGSFTLTVRTTDNSLSTNQVFKITKQVQSLPLSVEPTEVSILVGSSASVNISGGIAPYQQAEPVDDTVASVTITDSVATITGESAGEMTISFSDAEGTTISVAVIVTAEEPVETQETCEASGNIWVNEKCEPLPFSNNPSGEGNAATFSLSNGIQLDSNAQFSGGWSLDGGLYQTTVNYGGEELSLANIIRFAPEHAGKTVDIIAVLNITIGEVSIWYQTSATHGFIPWSNFNLAPYDEESESGLDAFMSHEVTDEPLVMGPFPLGVLEDFPSSTVSFYFAYRLNNGDIHLGAVPITFVVP